MGSVKHFVLIHGACHGSWCWYKLVTLLKQGGHLVTALDLGACGINPKQLKEVHSVSSYVQPLMEFLASLPSSERVILVGHSYAGLCISLAMERFPEKISVSVFLTAYMPDYNSPPGILIQQYFGSTPAESLLDCQYAFDNGLDKPPTCAVFGPDYMRIKLYKYCRLEDLELGKLLLRPTGLFMEDLSKEGLLTEEKYGSVKRVFIVCEEDDVMTEEFQRWMIQNSPPQVVKTIERSAHMVMLSKPEQLCHCLEDVAQ
ncbi:Salicylic acid-binding protein 2 [Quillaja saponaria]|uniref:(S)-hydroxynitrile lyase n=1 Tax=Quillaja saponaria TaxID=32244 RepID=A0AAD7L849_QUISA|nr:Salicylic acid-binding protein 2 [Quillaja saponaria]